jgi:glycosyltransferase involved in cell wall biosynthesis
VVAVNGSTDDTEGVVQRAALTRPNVRLVTTSVRGKGVAVKTGALQSRGEVVFICDADLSMPPATLSAFLEAINEADVVVGSREAPGAKRYNEPWKRHLMGRIFNFLVQRIAVQGIEDTQCGFKALRREAAHDLFSQQTLAGFGFDVEMLYLARKYGYRIKELGIDWYFDADTRVQPGTDTLDMLGEMLLMRLRDLQGRYRAPGKVRREEKSVR